MEEDVDYFKIDKKEENELGKGSYGVVFPGINTITKDKIAAKRIQCEKRYWDEELKVEVRRELEILLKVPPHENIVKFLHYAEKDITKNKKPHVNVWLIIEFCTLGNLKDYVTESPVNDKQKHDLFLQASKALQHLHNCKPNSVTHRDLKPENILLTGHKDRPTVKLADFGTARTIVHVSKQSVAMGSIRGTFEYMAPELYSFTEKDTTPTYNKKLDQFSLGVCFLAVFETEPPEYLLKPRKVKGECLGRVMYQNRSTGYVVQIHRETDSPFLRAIKNIIHPMIALHQSDRPSIDEVVDKLSYLMDSPLNEVVGKLSHLMDSPSDRILMIDLQWEKSVWIRENDEWQKISDVPKECASYYACYCRISDGIVAMGAGGWFLDPVRAQCHHFSLSTRQWRRMQDIQTARFNAAAVLLEGEVYVFGGPSIDDAGEGIAIAACEKLNIQANTWTSIRDLPEPLERPLVTAARGKAYIIPREKNITAGNRLQLVEYDPRHDRYSAQCQLPENVKGTEDAHLVGVADQLYLFRSQPDENGIYQYNLSNGQWSNVVVANTPDLHSYLGEASSGKLMWTETDKVYEYDRDSHQWSTLDYKLPHDHYWDRGFVTLTE